MDCSVYEAAESGNIDDFFSTRRPSDIHDLLLQKTPQDNNVLHIAAKHGQINFFEHVPLNDPRVSALFWATNKKGDTPLHVAAKVGSDDIVSFLIEQTNHAGEVNQKLLRMSNRKNDTALHVAARSGHLGVVRLLLAADPGMSWLTNIDNESPLFVATRQGYPRIAHSILNDGPKHPSYVGFTGLTALHVAVTHATEEFDIGILETMVAKNPELIQKTDYGLGWTPLHYAALRGNLEATRLLMQSDRSVSYIPDKSGMSALHVAAYAGHTNIMEELIRLRPDVCDLLNKKGQTALHAAVLGGQINVIVHSLNNIPKLAVLINEADEDGNTPLHLAALKQDREVISKLARDPRVDKTAFNENLAKASDIFLCNNMGEQNQEHERGCERGVDISKGSTALYHVSASSIGLPFFEQEIIHGFWKFPGQDTLFATAGNNDKVERQDSRLVIATLISTVTFTAAFTVPGGLRSADGKPVLNGNPFFLLFKVFNQVSFASSSFVIFNEVVDQEFLPTTLVAFLIRLSIGGIIAAFCTGTGAMQNAGMKSNLFTTFAIMSFSIIIFILLVLLTPVYASPAQRSRYNLWRRPRLLELLPKFSPPGFIKPNHFGADRIIFSVICVFLFFYINYNKFPDHLS